MTSGLIYECHCKLSNICNDNRLTLQWIKGHSGSRGNDAADCLAREGSSRTAIGPEPIVPIPYRQLRTWIRERCQRQHDEYWAKHTDCRQAREAVPKPFVQSLLGGRGDERPCSAGVQRRCKTKDFSNGKPADTSRSLQQHPGTAELFGGVGMAGLMPIPTQNRHLLKYAISHLMTVATGRPNKEKATNILIICMKI
ncbi:hypothetical protein evm_000210 [Chilo suppressalis]|nr:hypothetical protein evm_000210 [Chilo suppressalis]